MKRWGIAVLLIAATTVVSTASAKRTVCMAALGGCGVRPHLVPYGAHAAVRHIHWSSWGGARAVGYGSIEWGKTVTEPAYGPYAAKIVVSEPAECRGRIWYSRRTIKIGRHLGRTLEKDEAFGPCYYP